MMRERQDRLFGVTRLHTPSTDEPLIVVMVDELAALTAWVNDRAVKKRIESALGLLLVAGPGRRRSRSGGDPGPAEGRAAAT